MFEDLRRFNEMVVSELSKWSIIEYQETIMLVKSQVLQGE